MKLFLDLKDKRIVYLKKWLEDKGYIVLEFCQENMQNLRKNDVCLLSPAFKFSVELANALPQKIFIFSGNIDEKTKEIFDKKGIYHYSFLSEEDFILENANLTAEGMLADLITHTQKSIFKQKILILGSGRVAKAVAFLFFKLGIVFDVTMRNEGDYKTFRLIANNCLWDRDFVSKLNEYDVVINTIPAKIFDQSDIGKFKKDCVVFELASKQCFEGLDIRDFSYILCPALPSVFSPISAGDLMKKKFEDFLQKGEKND